MVQTWVTAAIKRLRDGLTRPGLKTLADRYRNLKVAS